MLKFFEWCRTKGLMLSEGMNPTGEFAQAHGWEQIEALFHKYKGAWVQFKDESGKVMKGKMVDVLGEGVFVIQTEDGQQHDVEPSQIVGASGGRPDYDDPAYRQKRADRFANRPMSNDDLGYKMKRDNFKGYGSTWGNGW